MSEQELLVLSAETLAQLDGGKYKATPGRTAGRAGLLRRAMKWGSRQ